MLNNRDDENKYEGNEDSEYHFTDEDVSYESESEPSTKSTRTDTKPNILTRLTSSKRMLGAGALLLVLVYVIYKLAAPAVPTAPSVDIVSAPPVSTQTPVTPVVQPNVTQPAKVEAPPIAPPAPSQAAAPTAPANLPPAGATLQNEPRQSTQTAPTSQVVVVPGAYPQSEAPASIPPVIPVQSVVPSSQPMTSTIPATNVMTSSANYQVPGMSAAEVRAQSMASDRDRLLIQLQTEYTQKLNEFTTQNKALQDQLQTLNSRVAGLESQLSQLLQALSRQQNQTTSRPSHATPPQAAPKISYNVQAIIPGRAWLKSDNGETVTVAEGDLIKGLGRITKIDPYDGIVEINTGNRMVSLSYGNGG